jgi:hypothetical protein
MKINIKYFPLLLLLFSILFFISCSKKEDKNLNKDRFIEIYSDILLISANNKFTDTERKSKIDSLFKSFNTNEKAFRNTVEEFNENPEEWKEIYKKMLDRFEKMKDTTKQK